MTYALFILVILFGLAFCSRTIRSVQDRSLRVLFYLWPIKVLLTVFLLYAGWVSDLDHLSPNWGGDASRYYYDSYATLNNSWIPTVTLDGVSFIEGTVVNYTGILYYYGLVFYLFGHDPLAPALINAFVTLLATLFLIQCAYNFMPNRTVRDSRIAFLLLVPEVAWYDVMTSRETLVAALILVGLLSAGRYLVASKQIDRIKCLILVAVAATGIVAVRTVMIIPVVASIGLMGILLRGSLAKKPSEYKVLLSLGLLMVFLGPMIQEALGGYSIDYLTVWDTLQSFSSNLSESAEWSNHSIGLLLVPDGFFQSIIFIWPRMLLYLAAPLPNVNFDFLRLFDGNYEPWNNLATATTSVMMLLSFPYVLAGSSLAWQFRKNYPAMLIIPVAFWVNFLAVAGGNFIIHERYRLMFTLLLFGCAWIGYTRATPRLVNFFLFSWSSLLLLSAAFYFFYKAG